MGLGKLLGDFERVAADESTALRWSRAGNIHLTLHFLGDLDEARETAVRAQLDEPLATDPFDVTLGELGLFPPSGRPRVFWVAVEHGRRELLAIHAELSRRLVAAGVEIETRPFAPHLTLARVRDGHHQRARRVAERLRRVTVPSIQWPVSKVVLYHSDLSGPAPRYEAVQHVPLRGSPGTLRE